MSKEVVKAYCAKRDAAALGTLEEFMKFASEQGQVFSSARIAEIAQHKMRAAILALPAEVRAASRSWLEQHGYESCH